MRGGDGIRRTVLTGPVPALSLSGCARSVLQQPHVSVAGICTHGQMRRAILPAGAGPGWKPEKASSSYIRGMPDIRSHRAEIDITYTAEEFAIDYADPINLRHDGHAIHPRCHARVIRLRNAILRQLSPAQPDTY